MDEKDGRKVIRTLAKAPRAARRIPEGSDLRFGLFTGASLTVEKGSKRIELTSAETAALIDFLDAINIERIASRHP